MTTVLVQIASGLGSCWASITANVRFIYFAVSWIIALIIALAVFAPGSAQAICGKECREARDFCKTWESTHPGQTCGRVRGAICSGSAWDKIKQVNWAWSACKLVEGSADHAAAQARCDAFEENWGGDCQVHSPLCNAGWIKLQAYGKFRACRKIEFTGTILDLYHAYMRKWEGLADHSIPAHLKPFISEQYGIDPDTVRWGRVPETDNSTCITDCNRINCDKDWVLDRIESGYDWHIHEDGGTTNLLFHELVHVEQCKREGGRDNYAMLWFSNLPLGIINALITGQKVKADNVHDLMPMEIEGDTKGTAVANNYVNGWWHTQAHCRIYRSDRKVVVWTSQDPHPRAFCDFKYDWQGARFLKEKIRELSFDWGNGTYHVGFGRPDENNGVWIGSMEVKNPIIDAAFGATVSGDVCPKPVSFNILVVTDEVREVRLRYKVGDKWSGWKKITSKALPTANVAQYEVTAQHFADPGKQKVFVEIGDYPRVLEQEIEVTCPPFAATKVDYSVRIAMGDLCPRRIDDLINFETNGPGTVRFGFRTKGQGDLYVEGGFVAPTERSGNRYVASFRRDWMQESETDMERRVETLGTGLIFSDWKPIRVECLEILDSAIFFDGPDEGTCTFKTDVRLRVNADMESDLPYRLDCADGQAREGTLAIRNTGPGSFIGVDTTAINVEKTDTQACALKADLGRGLQTLTFQGHSEACLDILDAGLYVDGPDQGPCPTELGLRMRFNARDIKPVGYGLKCSNGQHWTGKLRVKETSPGTFIGVTTKPLEIAESGQVACALRSFATGIPKVVALRGKTFQCADVARPGAGSDLTGDQRDPAASTKCVDALPPPDTKPVAYAQAQLARLGFDPGPIDGKMGPRTGEAIGAFQEIADMSVTGRVDTGLLQALQRYGQSWREGELLPECRDEPAQTRSEPLVEPVADPSAETETMEPGPVVSLCRNGAIRAGQCVCPAGWDRRRLSRFQFVCQPPLVRIICENGKVRAGECVCPAGWGLRKRAANRFSCVRPIVRITCEGGDVIGSKCVCPTGTTLRQRLANNFECVKPPRRPIVCQNGVVREGECYCPQTMNRRRLSANRFLCVCKPGLKRIRGQCIRPAG